MNEQRTPSTKSQLWNPQTILIPSALVHYTLRFSQTNWCYNDKTTEFIVFILSKIVVITFKKGYLPSHTTTEDIRHNITTLITTNDLLIKEILEHTVHTH